MMTRISALFVALAILPCARLSANDFQMKLEVMGKGSQHINEDQPTAPARGKPPARRSVSAPADEKLTADWTVSYIAKPMAKDVLVHFYVVKIERAGQAPPALNPKIVLIESALTMDFEAETVATAKLNFSPVEAGIYLVRIEAQGPTDQSFAEMELVIK